MQVSNEALRPKIEKHTPLGKPMLTIMKKLGCCCSNVRYCLNLFHSTAFNSLKTNFNGNKSFQATSLAIAGIHDVIIKCYVRPFQATRLSTRSCLINKLCLKLFSLTAEIPLETGESLCSSRCLKRTNHHHSKHKPSCNTKHYDKK